MLVSFEQLKNIVFGACSVAQENGYIRFFRFNDNQIKAYIDTENEDFIRKQYAAAGIRLSFKTSSKNISFDYRLYDGSSRKYAYFDVCEDGVITKHFGVEECCGEYIGHAEIELSSAEKTEIYFPWSKRVDIKNFSVEDGAEIASVKRKGTIICYGDSITQGYDSHYPSLAYASKFAQMLDMDLINRAVGAEVFFPHLLDFYDTVNPDIVLTAYGTNDWNRLTLDNFKDNATEFILGLSRIYPDAKKVVITPIWRADKVKSTNIGISHKAVSEFIGEICRENNISVIDGYELTPHLPKFYADGYLHPNDFGNLCYSSALYAKFPK